MSDRRMWTLCLALALACSGIATGGASAATKGTTAFTSSSGHKEISATNFQSTGGEVLLHSTISGIEVELKATEALVSGTLANSLGAGGEHVASGTGTSEYKNVTVVKPAGKGCEVETGAIKSNELKATTAGQGMGLKFEPNSGTTFATFVIKGCGPTEALKALNGPYEVTGSVVSVPTEGTNQSVFERTQTTNQGTFKLRGQKAGIKAVTNATAGELIPVVTTTVETP